MQKRVLLTISAGFLVCLFCFCYTGILYAATPFDDFSGSRIDSSKWYSRDWSGLERVREVTGGKLISKIGGPVGDPGSLGNGLHLPNPNNINTIEAKVSITKASIDGDNIHLLVAQIMGAFYEAVGGHEVMAFVSLQFIGSGYEASYQVQNSTGWDGGIFALAIQTGTEYTLKIDYNPVTQEFIFSANGENHSITGEPRNGPPINGGKNLGTGIIGDPNGGSGYLSATFDDVEVNNAPYDDFSVSPLSFTKWSAGRKSGEKVREIRDGQLQMNVQNFENYLSSNELYMQPAQVTDYFQADVTMNSDTVLTGDSTLGEIRLYGTYYNYKYNGSGYDNLDGEIFANVRVRWYSDGRLRPYASIVRCEDASCDNHTDLLSRDFSCAVQLDTPVTLAIEKKGSTLVFSCDQEQFSHPLSGPLYDSANILRKLRSAVYSAPAEHGYLKATVDNVYASPGSASFNTMYTPVLNSIIAKLNEVTTVESAGQVWMDRNLGASRVATSSTDEEAYGDLYQWGRLTDGHEKRTSSTTTTLSTTDVPGHDDFITTNSGTYDWRSPQNNTLWQGATGINNPCPAGFRLPTETEWEAERASWGTNNSAGAFASPLKLVLAGYRSSKDGTLYRSGITGDYWASTVYARYGRTLRIFSYGAYNGNTRRAAGKSLRCLKD